MLTPPRSSYAFVMNIGSLAEPITLVRGHELRRATDDEIDEIQKTLDRLAGFIHYHVRHLWEGNYVQGQFNVLPRNEWRYFLIAFQGLNETIGKLQQVFDITSAELEFGFTMMHHPDGGSGFGWQGARLFQVLERTRTDGTFFLDVTRTNIDEFSLTYPLLWDNDDPAIRRQVAQLGHLKTLPHDSPLRFLGYFAILESILTHQPKPLDPYDSITRQIKKKLELLQNRWPATVDYGPFGTASHETVWSAMYAYRSGLAHGSLGEVPPVLRNVGQAMKLLVSTTKSVIQHALREPQLLRDLREC